MTEKSVQELFEDFRNGSGSQEEIDNLDNNAVDAFEFPEGTQKVKIGEREYSVDELNSFLSLGEETHKYMEENKPTFRSIDEIEKEEKATKENYEKDGTNVYNEFLLKAYNHAHTVGVKSEEMEQYKQMASHWLLEGYKTGNYTNFRNFINQNDAVELDKKINDITKKYDGLLSSLEEEKGKTKYKGNVDKVSELVSKYDTDEDTKKILSALLPELTALNVPEKRIQEIAGLFKGFKKDDSTATEAALKLKNNTAKKNLMATSVGKTSKTQTKEKKVSLESVKDMNIEEIDENLNELYSQFKSKK